MKEWRIDVNLERDFNIAENYLKQPFLIKKIKTILFNENSKSLRIST